MISLPPSFLRRSLCGIPFFIINVLFVSVLCLIVSGRSAAVEPEGNGPFRDQVIQLDAGWNAVYIDLEPVDGSLESVFKDSPVEIVASYFRPVTSMEFIDSPNEVLPDRKAWSVWYAPHREDAVLSNLNKIQAHHSYLIYAEEAHSLSITGVAYFDAPRWYPNSYGLVGFPITAGNQPTMSQFFDSALAQSSMKIYTLRSGNWTLVTNPAAEMMQPNKAYWVYSDGASDFKGPINVDFSGSSQGGISFSKETITRGITISNVSSYPQSLSLSLKHGKSGNLPVSYVVRVLGGVDEAIKNVSVPFPESLEIGPIEPGQSFKFDIEVDQKLISAPVVSATLSILTDAGFDVDVPLVSLRRDLIDGL